ncbi:MAG: DMT family transporter [Alphaproteobacteria bacterium]|nr:DMT family transporter [Alphaproteobacteria bacterium]
MTPPIKAALWMSGAIFSFTAMAIAAREISQTHDSFEIMAARSIIGLVLVLGFGLLSGQLARMPTQRLSGHFWRNLVHFTAQNLWFWSLTVIPLAQVFALEFTSPIWVILLSPLFLGERLTRAKAFAAGLGFAGILILARPDLTNLTPGVLAAAGSALGFAATSILTKRLTRGEAIITILFWLTAFQAIFGLLAAGHDGLVNWPTAQTLPWLVLIGICGVLAHLSLTTALTLAPASVVMPIDFVRLPLISIVGALAYGEAIDPFVLGGGAVIFLGIWISIRAELRERRIST